MSKVLATLCISAALVIVQTGCRPAAQGHYDVYAISNDGKQLAPGIDGNILLSATGLQLALQDINAKGYRLHSVVCNGSVGGYMVIIEH